MNAMTSPSRPSPLLPFTVALLVCAVAACISPPVHANAVECNSDEDAVIKCQDFDVAFSGPRRMDRCVDSLVQCGIAAELEDVGC